MTCSVHSSVECRSLFVDLSQRLRIWESRGRGWVPIRVFPDRDVIWSKNVYRFPWIREDPKSLPNEDVTTITRPCHYWPRGTFRVQCPNAGFLNLRADMGKARPSWPGPALLLLVSEL